MAWESKENGVEKGREKGSLNKVQWFETERSIERKCFLDADFTTKNCFRALNPRLRYRFHHLIKTKTNLNTTLIDRIRDKQVENKVTQRRVYNSTSDFNLSTLSYKMNAKLLKMERL